MKLVVRVVLVLAVLAQAWSAYRATDYDRAFREGRVAFGAADVDRVTGALEEAVAVDTADPYLWAWVGDAYMYVHDWHAAGEEMDRELSDALLDRAWTAYAASVARCPPYAWSWAGLAQVSVRKALMAERFEGVDLGRFSRTQEGLWDAHRGIALEAAYIATELKPYGFQELDVLAEVYAAAGMNDTAVELRDRSARLMPAASFHEWGNQRLYGDHYVRLREALEAGVDRAPPFEQSLLNIEVGRFARLQGDLETALARFRAAEEVADNEYQASRGRWEQALCLREMGRFEEAIEAARSVTATPWWGAGARRLVASLHEAMGQHEDACVTIRRLYSETGDASFGRRGARSCEDAGDVMSAERLFESLVKDPPNQLDDARALIDFQIRQDRTRAATRRLEVWRRDYPDVAEFAVWESELQVLAAGDP